MTYMTCMTLLTFNKSFRVLLCDFVQRTPSEWPTICRRQITSAFICIIAIYELYDLFDLKEIFLCDFVWFRGRQSVLICVNLRSSVANIFLRPLKNPFVCFCVIPWPRRSQTSHKCQIGQMSFLMVGYVLYDLYDLFDLAILLQEWTYYRLR